MPQNAISRLTPYMKSYSEEFADNRKVNWQPYTMYFHPFGYASDVVNTDESGFRYSRFGDRRISATDHGSLTSVRVIAGSSTVFGIGASSDDHTLASRLSFHDPRRVPWLNFGARSFNSTQEMILFALNRHRLPKVEEVILFSGFNDLGLARLPARLRQEHGAFFMCGAFYDAMSKKQPSKYTRWLRADEGKDQTPSLEEQIDYAADLTLRNLANWRALVAESGAKLTFVLQPLSNWVRTTGSVEEQELFRELERNGRFAETYGEILTQDAWRAYSDRLADGAAALGVGFVNLTEYLKARIADDYWLFVDRIHFTDQGHDTVAKLLLEVAAPEIGEHRNGLKNDRDNL